MINEQIGLVTIGECPPTKESSFCLAVTNHKICQNMVLLVSFKYFISGLLTTKTKIPNFHEFKETRIEVENLEFVVC